MLGGTPVPLVVWVFVVKTVVLLPVVKSAVVAVNIVVYLLVVAAAVGAKIKNKALICLQRETFS